MMEKHLIIKTSNYNKFTNNILTAKIKEKIWLINLTFLDL